LARENVGNGRKSYPDQLISDQCPSLYALFYRIPVGVKNKMDRIRNNFLWDETEEKNKYHLVNW
jgi:hypothetical protein